MRNLTFQITSRSLRILRQFRRSISTTRAIAAVLVFVSPGQTLVAQEPTRAEAPSRIDEGPSEASLEELAKKLKAIEERDKTFKFGLSVGWRHLWSKGDALRRDATIDPATNAVVADQIDRGDVVLSAVVVAFPWKQGQSFQRIGFIANVDLAAFGSENFGGFNKSVEGGGGVALRLSDGFSVAATVERVFSRTLRDFVTIGKPLHDADGKIVTSLQKTDDRFFRNDNLTALSLKFVYFIR